jgi:hypothetical protein
MHYILIIGMLSMPFPTYEDCLVVQSIRGGQCVAKSYGTNYGTEWVNPYPLVTAAERARDAGVKPLQGNIKAFIDGFKLEMAKQEVREEDV